MYSTEDYRWLITPEATRFWDSIVDLHNSQSSHILQRARSSFSLSQASLMMEQFALLSVSRKKVVDPTKWFWTRQLIEQASDESTACETAADFSAKSSVLDVCCGAGSDSIALASRDFQVTAYDRCPIACELTRHNAEANGVKLLVVESAAEEIKIDKNDYINVDPDRRAEGRKVTNLEWLSPPIATLQSLLENSRGMSLKLSPGLRIDPSSLNENRLVPDAIRYLSKDHAVKQQRWYWGIDRWPSNSVVVSVNSKSTEHQWVHEIFLRDDNLLNSQDVITNDLPEFIGDYDPAIRAAEMGHRFAARYGWGLIDTSSGYLVSTKPTPHPMVRWFRLMHDLPMDRKQIKILARSLKPKAWELKSRGVEVDLDVMRKILTTDSDSSQSLTILFTKTGKSHRALICCEA